MYSPAVASADGDIERGVVHADQAPEGVEVALNAGDPSLKPGLSGQGFGKSQFFQGGRNVSQVERELPGLSPDIGV
jgi:hypothetical protein